MMGLVYKILNSSLFKASGIYTLSSIINAVFPSMGLNRKLCNGKILKNEKGELI